MHDPQPPLPPTGCHTAFTAPWEHPDCFRPFFEATPEKTMHDFLVAVPRPDLIPKTARRRSDSVYTVDLP